MVQIHHSGVVCVASEIAFDYLDDYRNVTNWMFGVTQFEPVSDVTYGLGVQFATSMQVGPKSVRSVVEITEWQQNRLLTLESISGFKNSSSWEFEPLNNDEARLTVDFGYTLPGGLAGKALDRLLEPFVGQAIRHTESTLRSKIEGLYPPGS